MENELKPCPFCGNRVFVKNDFDEYGKILCTCGCKMECKTIPKHFEHVGDDIYRQIPERRGFEIAVEKWNRRVNDG